MRLGLRTFSFFAVLGALLASAALAAPAMAATTYYASPTGSGSTCSESAPCAMTTAVKKAQAGDSVLLGPGTYTLTSSLLIEEAINFGGESAATTTIEAIGAELEDYYGANATLHDFRLDTTAGLTLRSGTAERVFVDDTAGLSTFACSMSPGTTLLDSVCWAHGSSPSGGAVIAEDGGGVGNTVTLRNDTLIAANPEGLGILAEVESPTGALTIAATNVIASGTRRDVFAVGNGGSSKAAVILANSDYSTVKEMSTATITPPGTNGGRTAAPAFVSVATGNFAEAAGSPTIDGGLTEAANGAAALGSEARALPAICGGTPATDIGAYEFVPTCAPPTPPVTVNPAPAPSNVIRIGKLKRHPKKGTATLVVWVPDAGTLTLGAKGVKKVKVQAKGAAKLKLPIKPVGKAKRQLAAKGNVKLKLKLSFVPVGGTIGLARETAKLSQRLR
jgi:hypothetical protein